MATTMRMAHQHYFPLGLEQKLDIEEYLYGKNTQIFPSDSYRSERNGRKPPASGFAVKVKS